VAVELTPDFEEVAAEIGEHAPESGFRTAAAAAPIERARKRSA
jgi:hypothetical protein